MARKHCNMVILMENKWWSAQLEIFGLPTFWDEPVDSMMMAGLIEMMISLILGMPYFSTDSHVEVRGQTTTFHRRTVYFGCRSPGGTAVRAEIGCCLIVFFTGNKGVWFVGLWFLKWLVVSHVPWKKHIKADGHQSIYILLHPWCLDSHYGIDNQTIPYILVLNILHTSFHVPCYTRDDISDWNWYVWDGLKPLIRPNGWSLYPWGAIKAPFHVMHI